MTLEKHTPPRSRDLGINDRSNGACYAAAGALTSPSLTSVSPISPPTSVPPVQQPGRSRNAPPSDEALRLTTQLLAKHRGSHTGHYGLTVATTVCDQPDVGVGASLSTSPSSSHSSTSWAVPRAVRPAHAWKPPDWNPPEGAGSGGPPGLEPQRTKRPAAAAADSHDDVFRVPAKKPRLLPPGKLDLGQIVPPRKFEDLPLPDASPLFFSTSSARPHMTGRPPSFSTSEPASAMLNRLREEPNIVRTVKLPKGPASAASPARHYSLSSTPGSGGPDSPSSQGGENRQLPSELRDLQGLSVIDLLEADERPSFIIDLSNNANFSNGPLKLMFANASLRASQPIYELISQSTEHSSEFSRFKSWAVSFVRDHRAMDVCLPSLSYGGISWTCSTLANRFRFVSGSTSAVSITPTSPMPPARATAVLEQRARGLTPSRDALTPSRDTPASAGRDRALSDLDYFGDAVPDPGLAAGSRRAQSEPREYRDPRPDTPVLPIEEDIPDDPEELGLLQTFDWTRIQDTSGEFQRPPFFARVSGHGRQQRQRGCRRWPQTGSLWMLAIFRASLLRGPYLIHAHLSPMICHHLCEDLSACGSLFM